MIKNTGGQIIGFTQLGGMNECTLAQVESKGCTDDESVEHPPIADHIMVLLIRGLFFKLNFRCIKTRESPFSARGSPILELVELLRTVN